MFDLISSHYHQVSNYHWIRLTLILWMLFLPKASLKEISQPNIIIVGAGVSGIAAASRLIENGFTNIKILEAENRIGGRVNSVNIGNWTVDLGGHWVHGETGNAVYDIAAPLGLLDNNTNDFSHEVSIFSDKVEVKSNFISIIFDEELGLLSSFNLRARNDSLYNYMLGRLGPILKSKLNSSERSEAYMKWILTAECNSEGCDKLEDVSTKGLAEYELIEGSNLVSWKGKGYKSIIDLLLKRHEKSLGPPIELEQKLYLSSEVTSIIQTSKGIQVQCKDGSTFNADIVIVTVSLGVLKDTHTSLFQPQLPQYKKKAIEGLGIGTVDKIILRFPYAWWPSNISGFEIIWLEKDRVQNENQLSWEYGILNFSSEHGSPFTLTAWLNGEAARIMESHSLEEVKKGTMKVLQKFLGHKYLIPEPVEVLRSCWGTNSHYRGSYSYRRMASDSLNVTAADLAKPVTDGKGREIILFAGEATHDHYYSTVHGALETGWREADRIMKMYKG